YGIALDRGPDVAQGVEFRPDGQVVAERPGVVDRPDRHVGDGTLQGGQRDIPVIDSQQAEVVTHRPTPSPDDQRERPALVRTGTGRGTRRWVRRPTARLRLNPESLARNRVATPQG